MAFEDPGEGWTAGNTAAPPAAAPAKPKPTGRPGAPVAGRISQGFGPTSEPLDGPYGGYAHFNKGYDYAVPVGTPVHAVMGGTVIAAGDQGDGWGISVKIKDFSGIIHNYGHLSAANVAPGQQVNDGDLIAASGDTGHSTGPHLSYDVYTSDGKFIDPKNILGDSAAPAAGPSAGGAMPTTQALNDLVAVRNRLRPYEQLLQKYQTPDGKPAPGVQLTTDPATGAYVARVADPLTKLWGPPIEVLNPAQYTDYIGLTKQFDNLYGIAQSQQQSPAELIAAASASYNMGNSTVDAENAAKRYARDLSAANAALSASANEYQQQSANQNNRVKGFNDWARGHGAGESAVIPDAYLPTQSDLYAKQLSTIKASLPDVPNMPYYTPDQQSAAYGGVGYKTAVDSALVNNDQVASISGSILNNFNPTLGF